MSDSEYVVKIQPDRFMHMASKKSSHIAADMANEILAVIDSYMDQLSPRLTAKVLNEVERKI